MEELRELTAEAKVGRPRRGGVELSARAEAGQGRRDRGRHLRLCRAHGGADGREYHQGEAADRRGQPGSGEEDLRDRISTAPPWPSGSRMSCRPPSPASASWCSPAARRRTWTALYEEVRGMRDGGANGCIIGRNTFQRPKEEALEMLAQDHRHLPGQGMIPMAGGERLPALSDHPAGAGAGGVRRRAGGRAGCRRRGGGADCG